MQSLSSPPRSAYWVDGFPELIGEWDRERNGDLSPADLSAGSGRRVWWTCPRGPDHRWRAKPNNRTRGTGCPFCANKRVSVTNSLAALFPDIAREWDHQRNGTLTPLGIVATATRNAWWQCHLDPLHAWRASVRDRTRDLSSCPFCSNRRVCASNSLLALHSEIAGEWHPVRNGVLAADQVTPGSARRVWWLCRRCNRSWQASVANRVSRSSRCPACAVQTRAHPSETSKRVRGL
jgi:Probable Zinc-ribbon domain